MAPKRPNPMEDPPVASLSEDESDGEDLSEEDDPQEVVSSSGEEEDDEERTPLGVPVSAVVLPQPSNSDSGSETESDSDSGKEGTLTNEKPETVPTESVKDKSPVASHGIPIRETPIVKRAKTDNGIVVKDEMKPGEVTKKQFFHRLWTEDDEISLLKGMLDFKSGTGISPFDDTTGYYDFIKKSISFDVSKVQLMDKIRGLRKKYVNNLSKGKTGEEKTFSKPHDRMAFDLSKSIWGTGAFISDSAMKTNGRSKTSGTKKSRTLDSLKQDLFSAPKKAIDVFETSGSISDGSETIPIVKMLSDHGLDELVAKHGWARVSLEDKKVIEEKWKKLQIHFLDLYQQRIGFIKEVATSISEALHASDC